MRFLAKPIVDATADERSQDGVCPSSLGQTEKLFSCPFSKRYPERHECKYLPFPRLIDVKQHLMRRHKKPVYCPVCKEAFTNEDVRDSHTYLLSCQRHETQVEGLTSHQLVLLAMEISRSMSAEESWYAVWDIVFPDTIRPSSAYVDYGRSQTPRPIKDSFPDRVTDAVSRTLEEMEEPPDRKFDTLANATDSGYASIAKHQPQLQADESWRQAREDADINCGLTFGASDDCKTVYTGDTTRTSAQKASQCISEVCESIFHAVTGQVEDLPSVIVADLPHLLKAFAVKLGSEKSTPRRLEVMRFVHKHHKYITDHLTNLLVNQKTGPELDHETSHGMSLEDKMQLWADKDAKAVAPDVREGGFFEGVNDDLDDEADCDSDAYQSIIHQSHAYEWIVLTLQRAARTEVYGQGRNIMTELQEELLDHLPTGTISRHEKPSSHKLRFRAKIHPHNQVAEALHGNILNRIVYTGSINFAQRATIKEYLTQTWPQSGIHLCKVLEVLWPESRQSLGEQRLSATWPDGSHLNASFDRDSLLIVDITGTPAALIECGQQLAWLSAALREPGTGPQCHSPFIAAFRSKEVVLSNGEYIETAVCDIETRIEAFMSDGDFELPESIDNSTLVHGFPILRRPNMEHGLELTFDDLIYSFGSHPQIRDKRIMIPRRMGALFVWTMLNDIVCWSMPAESGISIAASRGLGLKDLASLPKGRHIVLAQNGEALRAVKPSGTSWDREATAKPFPEAEPNEVDRVESLLSSPNSTHESGRFHANDVDGALSHDATSGQQHADSASMTLATGSVDGHEFPHRTRTDEEVETTWDTASIQSQISPDEDSSDAIDSAVLSISESSEVIPAFSENSLAVEILEKVAQKLVCEFRKCTGGNRSTTNSNGSLPQLLPSSSSEGGSGSNSNSRKITRLGDGNDANDEGDEEDETPSRPRKKNKTDQGPVRHFACPFWKMSPSANRSCFKLELRRIRDVKQHLTRRHVPLYCERCLVTFPDEDNHLAHVRGTFCVWQPGSVLQGVSREQQRNLTRKSDRKLEPDGQWFAIWDILFPDKDRPSSAFIDQVVVEQFYLFREYAEARGPQMIAGEVEALMVISETTNLLENRQAAIQRVVMDGFSRVLDDWLSTQAERQDDSTRADSIREGLHASAPRSGGSATRVSGESRYSASSRDNLMAATEWSIPASNPSSIPRTNAQASSSTTSADIIAPGRPLSGAFGRDVSAYAGAPFDFDLSGSAHFSELCMRQWGQGRRFDDGGST